MFTSHKTITQPIFKLNVNFMVNQKVAFSRSCRRVKYSANLHYALLDYLGRARAILEREEKAPVLNWR